MITPIPGKETRAERDSFKNLSVKTDYELEGDRRLRVQTYRDTSGMLRTSAVVHKVDGFFETTAYGGPGGDFNVGIFRESVGRCTEKAMREQHGRALAHVESLLDRARNHYAAQRQGAPA